MASLLLQNSYLSPCICTFQSITLRSSDKNDILLVQIRYPSTCHEFKTKYLKRKETDVQSHVFRWRFCKFRRIFEQTGIFKHTNLGTKDFYLKVSK